MSLEPKLKIKSSTLADWAVVEIHGPLQKLTGEAVLKDFLVQKIEEGFRKIAVDTTHVSMSDSGFASKMIFGFHELEKVRGTLVVIQNDHIRELFRTMNFHALIKTFNSRKDFERFVSLGS